MAFPNALFPQIPLHTEVSDEEYQRFHTIDRTLVNKLIGSLNRNPTNAINVVSFLLWLERNKLSVNAVQKVLVEWPNYLVDILADQVVALLEWLKIPQLVWERRGDITFIQVLCHKDVGFIYLHQRRDEILEGRKKIATEMAKKAFRDVLPQGFEDRNVGADVGFEIGGGVGFGNIVGGAIADPRKIVNRINNGVQFGPVEFIGGGLGRQNIGGGGVVFDPRGLINRNQTGVQLGSVGGYVHSPREPQTNFVSVGLAAGSVDGPPDLKNYNHDGAGFPVRGRYIHDPREIMNENHSGVGYETARGLLNGRLVYDSRVLPNIGAPPAAGSPIPQTVPTFIPAPLQHTMNRHILRFGTVDEVFSGFQEPGNIYGGGASGSGIIQGYPGPDNMNEGGSTVGYVNDTSSNNCQIIPNVPFGPRKGYVDSNGQIQRPEMHTRKPIPENELSGLLRGLNIIEEETDVHEDDRTVFLTFSRGYFITEPEIWGYFTRRFGNFIKEIHMEEVAEGEQPLYARMVAQNTSIIPLICDVNGRTKYAINGKQVWAKKYVRKGKSPQPSTSSSASTSRQT